MGNDVEMADDIEQRAIEGGPAKGPGFNWNFKTLADELGSPVIELYAERFKASLPRFVEKIAASWPHFQQVAPGLVSS
jgi:hypothetical protein